MPGISVELEAGQLRLRIADASRRLRVGQAIRHATGVTPRPGADGYRIPISSLNRVVELLDAEGAHWADNVAPAAASARSETSRQLEARLLVSDVLLDPEKNLPEAVARLLDRHQQEAAAAIAVKPLRGLALFDEQGTGKTLSALGGYLSLRERGVIERALVVVPKSVIEAWSSDALKVDKDLRVAIAVGSATARRNALLSDHDVLIVTYEGLVADEKLLAVQLKAKPDRYMLIVDESYFAKNAQTRRAQSLRRLRPMCERGIVLCGTPAPNRPWDVVNQISLADGGIAYDLGPEPRDADIARERVELGLSNAIYLRRLKTSVLPDLPPQSFDLLQLDMAPVQMELYRQAATQLLLDVRSVTDEVFRRQLRGFLARRSALLQVCSHPGGLDPLYDEEPTKLSALRRLLREFIDRRGEKVVVWSWYRYSLGRIAHEFSEYGLARIDGSVASVDDRVQAIRTFQRDPSVRLFVGNAGAAGAGITLTAARTVIYESFSSQAAHFMQSIDRVHRRGQDRPVNYHVLLCNGSIEQAEYDRLVQKQRDARSLLGDVYTEPPSRAAFIGEIEGSLSLGADSPDPRTT